MSAPVASLDIETRSVVDLKTAGAHKYFEDPTTSVLVARWRIGDRKGNFADIQPLVDHIAAGGTVAGHNIKFDAQGWNTKIAPLRGYPLIKPEQCDDTMARCATLALPQNLDGAAKVVGASVKKDAEGHKLMMRMCRPKAKAECLSCRGSGWEPKFDTDMDIGSYQCLDCGGTGLAVEWHETPEQIARLDQYCEVDVDAEVATAEKLPPLTPLQRKTWLLDQKINARGVKVDLPLIRKAVAVAEVANFKAAEEMFRLTDGEVERPSQVTRIVKWLNSRGVVCASLGKGVVDDVLVTCDMFDDDTARKVIELRRASAKSSVAKYQAMINSACRDHRVRGTLAYHGASTGRWAGRLIQPQNFPRIGDASGDVEQLHEILNSYDDPKVAFDVASMMFDNPLDTLSKALRSMIVAEKGHRFIGADYSNIEGRVNAWLAGEHWKVKAFADFDAGIGHDLYNIAYGRSFGIDPSDVTKAERQIGKVMELSMGYQGGVRAFQKMGANYGVTVADDRADELKVAWREAHPAIQSSWYELQDAAIEAVRRPGLIVPCLHNRIQYRVANGILWCRLPSGRCIAYVHPKIVEGVFIEEDGTETPTGRPQVQFWGVESTTKKWIKQRFYGGLQCENVVQAIAYDILVEGMFRLEDAGYPIVLTVHDENIAECPFGFGSEEELSSLMLPTSEVYDGLPVAVSSWEAPRYVK